MHGKFMLTSSCGQRSARWDDEMRATPRPASPTAAGEVRLAKRSEEHAGARWRDMTGPCAQRVETVDMSSTESAPTIAGQHPSGTEQKLTGGLPPAVLGERDGRRSRTGAADAPTGGGGARRAGGACGHGRGARWPLGTRPCVAHAETSSRQRAV